MIRWPLPWILSVIAVVLISAPAWAQVPAPERAKLVITVVDQTGGLIPGATVTIGGQEPAATPGSIAPMATTTAGLAVFDSLFPGRYTIQAAFPGFETVVVPDVRLRAGETRRTIMLPIRKMTEDVAVGRDRQSAALDPRGNAFSTVLTREQIAALPDDPDEMEAALKAMAPPTGGKLPPKSQIRSIRLPRMGSVLRVDGFRISSRHRTTAGSRR